jgi:hypothetical protein
MPVLGPADQLPPDVARATATVAWVRTWKTWAPNYSPQVAYAAALHAVQLNPQIERYELAKVAANAARRAAWDEEDGVPAPGHNDDRRAVEAVALAKTWPPWRPDYDETGAYDRARRKAAREPQASTRALAQAALHGAAEPWRKARA